MKDIIVITGQTATGKTSKALALAQSQEGYLVSADSRQLYRELDIITGKDIEEDNYTHVLELNGIQLGYYTIQGVHVWGYDFITPDKHFSSHDYTDAVLEIINNTMNQSMLPIVVGGSYMYLQDLLYGFDSTAKPDWELRKQLEKKSVDELQDMLRSKYPESFAAMNRSDRHNPRRLIRRIEIMQSGPHTPATQTSKPSRNFNIIQFDGYCFSSDSQMRETIRSRVQKRIDNGAFEEVKSLLRKGYTSDDPGLKTIGYIEILEYIQGNLKREEAIERWITSEVQYAKRQWTFMKKNTDITWHSI